MKKKLTSIFIGLLLLLLPFSVAALSMMPIKEKGGTMSSSSSSVDVYESIAAILPAGYHQSSECWISAILLFETFMSSSSSSSWQQTISSSDTSKLCSILDPPHQKMLAFHLARCHLQEVGRPILTAINDDDKDSTTVNHNTNIPSICLEVPMKTTTEFFEQCLRKMTEAGVTAYTHFFTHINQLCTRLTHEVVISQQHETATRLMQLSQDATARMNAFIVQLDDLYMQQNEREQYLQKQQRQWLKEIQNDQIKLLEEQSSYLYEQQEMMRNRISVVVDNILEREEQQKKNHTDWLQNQNNLFQNYTKAFHSQHQKVLELEKTVTMATNTMKPLLDLNSFLNHATKGIEFVSIILHFIGIYAIVWVVTKPIRRCVLLRKIIFGVVIIELVAEIIIFWVTDKGFKLSSWMTEIIQDIYPLLDNNNILSSIANNNYNFASSVDINDNDDDQEVQQGAIISCLRQYTLYIEIGIYLFGLCLSFCCFSASQKALAMRHVRDGANQSTIINTKNRNDHIKKNHLTISNNNTQQQSQQEILSQMMEQVTKLQNKIEEVVSKNAEATGITDRSSSSINETIGNNNGRRFPITATGTIQQHYSTADYHENNGMCSFPKMRKQQQQQSNIVSPQATTCSDMKNISSNEINTNVDNEQQHYHYYVTRGDALLSSPIQQTTEVNKILNHGDNDNNTKCRHLIEEIQHSNTTTAQTESTLLLLPPQEGTDGVNNNKKEDLIDVSSMQYTTIKQHENTPTKENTTTALMMDIDDIQNTAMEVTNNENNSSSIISRSSSDRKKRPRASSSSDGGDDAGSSSGSGVDDLSNTITNRAKRIKY